MPRLARLDAPGLLHHVMVRGLNRQTIFKDDVDYQDFLQRIPLALKKSPADILAWALMPNHIHLLICSGANGLSPFMRRLLTGYAQAFNRRHHRVGYLFQGRYKSLVCDKEDYLLALVRYIHLNPVVAGILSSIKLLTPYPYTGHSTLMGRHVQPWQATDEVLRRFGKQAGLARRRYAMYLTEGWPAVKELPTDVLGAGILEILRESAQHARREEDRSFQDSRVLGEDDFVTHVWQQVKEKDAQRETLKRKGIDVRMLARRISREYGIEERQLFQRGRQAAVSAAKAVLIYAAIDYLGKTTQDMARLTRMSGPAAGKARWRGAQLAEQLKRWKTIVT